MDFESGVNNETYKYFIDFAAANGIPYVVLDDGWYDRMAGSAFAVVPQIDLPELISYADSKGVSLMLWVGYYVFQKDMDKIISDYAAMGIKGFKLHPLYQEKDIDDISFLRIIDCACELGLIVLIHAGRDLSFPGDHCTPTLIRHMLDEIKPRKMVLAHMGSYAYWDGVEEQLCGLGAYMDASFSVIPIRSKASMHGDEQTVGPLAGTDGEESHSHDIPQVSSNISAPLSRAQFRRIVAKNGADRSLFASDSPWGDQRETFDIVNSYLDARDKDAVFFKNALELLKS